MNFNRRNFIAGAGGLLVLPQLTAAEEKTTDGMTMLVNAWNLHDLRGLVVTNKEMADALATYAYGVQDKHYEGILPKVSEHALTMVVYEHLKEAHVHTTLEEVKAMHLNPEAAVPDKGTQAHFAKLSSLAYELHLQHRLDALRTAICAQDQKAYQSLQDADAYVQGFIAWNAILAFTAGGACLICNANVVAGGIVKAWLGWNMARLRNMC